LFTAIDCFTRFAIIKPIKNKEAETVANCVHNEIFLVHGFADLLCDRGTEFRNVILDALVKVTGQTKYHTTSYHAAGNGKVERLHRTFNSMLAKFVAESQNDWSSHVKELVFCYNSCPHSATGLSPHFLMTGQNLKWSIDLILGNPSTVEDYDSLPRYAVDAVNRLERAYHVVRKHLNTAAEANRNWYNKSVKQKEFKVGQNVRVYVPKKVQGRSPKLQSFYKETGVIVKRINDATYVVHSPKWREDRIIHTDKLRLMHDFAAEIQARDQVNNGSVSEVEGTAAKVSFSNSRSKARKNRVVINRTRVPIIDHSCNADNVVVNVACPVNCQRLQKTASCAADAARVMKQDSATTSGMVNRQGQQGAGCNNGRGMRGYKDRGAQGQGMVRSTRPSIYHAK